MRPLLGSFIALAACVSACSTPPAAQPPTSPAPATAHADLAPNLVPEISLPARIIYAPGPWERERAVSVNGKPFIERTTATPIDADKRWTVRVTQQPVRKPSAPPADAPWTDVQSLILSASDAGTSLHQLTNFARQSRATFSPPLILCPPTITSTLFQATSDVRSTDLDDTNPRTGTARATARAEIDASGLTIANLALEIKLGPATITRTADFTIAADAVIDERSELIVKGGPFVIQRERRHTTSPSSMP
jgi:hypothetical protein